MYSIHQSATVLSVLIQTINRNLTPSGALLTLEPQVQSQVPNALETQMASIGAMA